MAVIQRALPPDRVRGGVLATVVFAFLALVLSAVLLKKELSGELYFPLLIGAAAVSGVFGGGIATRKSRKNGLLNGVTSAVFPITAYLITVTALNRRFEIGSLLPCLALAVASTAAGIVMANRKNKPKIKKRK